MQGSLPRQLGGMVAQTSRTACGIQNIRNGRQINKVVDVAKQEECGPQHATHLNAKRRSKVITDPVTLAATPWRIEVGPPSDPSL